jgi:hypothetical protein
MDQLIQQQCAEGEVFNNATGICEPTEMDQLIQQQCAEGEVFNNATGVCESITLESILCDELGQVFNNATGVCESLSFANIKCPAGQIFNTTKIACQPPGKKIEIPICFPGQIYDTSSLKCEPPIESLGNKTEIAALQATNFAPTAIASASPNSSPVDKIPAGNTIKLIGSNSYPGKSDSTLIYQWNVPGAPGALTAPTAPVTNFITPSGRASIYEPELIVTEKFANTTIPDKSDTTKTNLVYTCFPHTTDGNCDPNIHKKFGIHISTPNVKDGALNIDLSKNPEITLNAEFLPFQPSLLGTIKWAPSGLFTPSTGPSVKFTAPNTLTDGALFTISAIAIENDLPNPPNENMIDSLQVKVFKNGYKPPTVNAFASVSQINAGQELVLSANPNPPQGPPLGSTYPIDLATLEWTGGECPGQQFTSNIEPRNQVPAKWKAPNLNISSSKCEFTLSVSDTLGTEGTDSFIVKVLDPSAKGKNTSTNNTGGGPGGGGPGGGGPGGGGPGGGGPGGGGPGGGGPGGGGPGTGTVSKPTTSNVTTGITSIEKSLSSQFKSKLTTLTTTPSTIPKLVKPNINCDPIQESIKLGSTTITQKELRILIFMDKCKIKQGTILIDLPKTPNLKLLAGDFDKSQIVAINTTDLQKIQTGIPTGSYLKLGKLAGPLFGKDLQTGLPKSVSTINGVILWNAGITPINMTATNNAEVVITFTK